MIRKMNKSDINFIMNIWYSENVTAHSFIPESYWKNNFGAAKAAILEAEVYVFEENNHIKGFIGLQGDYIAGIFVCKELQSQGIGGKLLAYVKNTKNKLTLGVYVLNEKAVKFYLSNGFKISSRSTDEETGQDEYIMEWEK